MLLFLFTDRCFLYAKLWSFDIILLHKFCLITINIFSDSFCNNTVVYYSYVVLPNRFAITSTHVSEIVADYRAARKDFETIVARLRDTVADAQRHAFMTGPALEKIGQAAEKLRHAQDAADTYLTKLNQALVEAHQLFSTNMQKTVREANKTFHQEITHTTQLISAVAADLEDVLGTVNTRQQ